MAERALMGARIREKRLDRGLRQSDLAARAGISASYLNLIEHDRRRIGGKLLTRLADLLAVDASTLADGVEAEIVAGLREAALSMSRVMQGAAGASPDGGQPAGQTTGQTTGQPVVGRGAFQATAAVIDRSEELASRFPGWAALVVAQHARIGHLERLAETLSDRLSHDPRLAASLHEVLSTVTSIRSTAAILSDTSDISDEWLARFHRNLGEDSARLADSAKALVAFLDGEAGGEAPGRRGSVPQEEFEGWLAAGGLHRPEVEAGQALDLTGLEGGEARDLARAWAERYAADAAAMPLAEVMARRLTDPLELARAFGQPLAAAFRRLTTLPPEAGTGPLGLVVCDGAGVVTFRHSVAGFQMPRLGAPCPLWPVFQVLSRPLAPVKVLVEQATRMPQQFVVWAVAEPVELAAFNAAPRFQATMLIRPATPDDTGLGAPVLAGTSCRVCPRVACPARRDASVLPG